LFPPLLAILLSVYYPALHGTLLWDDDGHITSSALRSLDGLWHIWFTIGATQQYYPITHTAFWLQWQAWGDAFVGYHVVNVTLHAISSVLLLAILRHLRVRGAVLAAVVFALHPVQVESVAWMTELKNALSGVFFFAAALAYLWYDDRRTSRSYVLAIAFFSAALLSKTVTATLPAALLVVVWWKRGALEWRRDIRPLVPFVAVGAAAGLVTSGIERSLIGAQGREFAFSPIERVLIAGRTLAFYAGKLLWPSNLTFIYPRWTVSQDTWWQYLFPLAILILFIAMWRWRHRSRTPFAAGLIFAGTLFPVLGFLNVYPFRYSFVADHFQYLACVALIVPLSAGLVAFFESRARMTAAMAEAVLCVSIGLLLASLSFRQAREYVSAEALYTSTLHRNPACWLCQENIGTLLLKDRPPRREEAVERFRDAIRTYPDDAHVHYNLGTTLMELGRLDESATELTTAVTLAPGYAEAYGNLGVVYQKLGRLAEARDAYRRALGIKPDLTVARANLAVVLSQTGQHDEAVRQLHERDQAHATPGTTVDTLVQLANAAAASGDTAGAVTYYRNATRAGPIAPPARVRFAVALSRAGELDEAVTQLEAAIREAPNDADAHAYLGEVLMAKQAWPLAVNAFERSLQLRPGDAKIHNDLGVALARLARSEEAVRQFREALRLQPAFPAARANLAKALAK